MKFFVLCGAVLPLLAAFPGVAFGAQQMEGESVHRATRGSRAQAEASARSIRAMPPPAAHHRLRRLNDDERRPASRKPGLEPAGIARAIPQETMATGEWSTTPEGRAVWRLSLESPDAAALRVHFRDFHIGGGKVWLLQGSAGEPVGPYTGDGPAGDGEFWSDIVEGSTVTVAWEPDTGTRSDSIPFRIPELSHRFQSAVLKSTPAAGGPDAPQAGAASCAVDATCYAEYSEAASAVALMIFESDGESYDCTGSLISSSRPDVPYFLTANHCISTPAEAKSVIAVFDYHTATCNGAPPRLRDMPRVNGSTYVAGGPMAEGDFTLLQLNRFPDVDVKLLGWSADPIAADEQVIGISHPRGDYRRISLGRRTRDVSIRFSDGDRMPARLGYQVTWYEGVTQGGSSGSPLLATVNGKQYVVGTLSAGPDVDENDSAEVCRTRNLNGSYGRFSAAYETLAPWLTGDAAPAAPAAPPAAVSAPEFTGSLLNVTRAGDQTLARISLSWNAPGVSAVQIRVGSPSGPAMTGIEGSTGSAETGDWVTDGMVFYLQDAASGDSSGRRNTLSAIQVSFNLRRP